MGPILTRNHRKIRVLVTKLGLDGHDRGAKIISRALRDAGMEVIYLGIRQTPGHIVDSAIQEDVDIIGISMLSGAHNTLVREVMQILKKRRIDDIKVIIGGIIPSKDKLTLKKLGVLEVFGPGALTSDIVKVVKERSLK
jgi:methylmalonyl-CoA mutase C-terminal domain/subunit